MKLIYTLLSQLFSKTKYRRRQLLHRYTMSLEIHSTADALGRAPDAIASLTQRSSLSEKRR
jgi:hypothetical protein